MPKQRSALGGMAVLPLRWLPANSPPGNAFDAAHRFSSSWLLSPWALFALRALLALYSFLTIFVIIGLQCVLGQARDVRASFSYFTTLSYWGLAFYFLFAAVHTYGYARTGTAPLGRWPRALQTLHAVLYTTIVTLPFIVSIVFWATLYTGPWFPTPLDGFSNISQHALNSVFAVVEIAMPRTAPMPWMHLVPLVLVLALYLAVGFLTYAAQGYYTYAFLDPGRGRGLQAAYIMGILGAVILIFCVVRGLVALRRWVTEVKCGYEGKFFERDELADAIE
ncbi:MAG: hypothetical protein M1829_003352 [Trizodia sp. TS-e1964]|nr:MAG: hypothetical protein M1829_003352 [Trizodia sp. TS-e1964]